MVEGGCGVVVVGGEGQWCNVNRGVEGGEVEGRGGGEGRSRLG